jgi:hypothetical protein
MKLVTIYDQSKHLCYELVLPPGTSVSDIRTHLNLHEEYVFALIATPHVTIAEDADVHAIVMNGDRLIGTRVSDVLAKAPVKIDSDTAREDLMSLLVIDDDPPSEPIDTSEDDAYIRSFFREKEEPGMKVVELRVPEREPLILEVSPGMCGGDLLAAADLAADCALVRACAPFHNVAREEALFDLLTDCEILYAFFPTRE